MRFGFRGNNAGFLHRGVLSIASEFEVSTLGCSRRKSGEGRLKKDKEKWRISANLKNGFFSGFPAPLGCVPDTLWVGGDGFGTILGTDFRPKLFRRRHKLPCAFGQQRLSDEWVGDTYHVGKH